MSLNTRIDSLATCIEIQIQENEKFMESIPDFEYGRNIRRQTEDHIVDLGELMRRD